MPSYASPPSIVLIINVKISTNAMKKLPLVFKKHNINNRILATFLRVLDCFGNASHSRVDLFNQYRCKSQLKSCRERRIESTQENTTRRKRTFKNSSVCHKYSNSSKQGNNVQGDKGNQKDGSKNGCNSLCDNIFG